MLFHNTMVDYKNLKDSLHINWVQAVVENVNGNIQTHVINNSAGINVIGVAEKIIYPKSKAQKMVFEAEEVPDEDINYFKTRSSGSIESGGWKSTYKQDLQGYMVRSPVPDNEYRYDQKKYVATFVLKIEKNNYKDPKESSTTNPEVVTINVLCKKSGEVLNSKVLRYNDFTGNYFENHLLRFSFGSQSNQLVKPDGTLLGSPVTTSGTDNCLESNEYRVDISVYWHGLVTTYLDKVIVEDSLGEELFAGKYDELIKSSALGFKNSNELLKRYYLADEPPISSFKAFKYVKDQILQVYGKSSSGIGGSVTAHYKDLRRFVRDSEPQELLVDKYVIYSSIPNPLITNDEADIVGIQRFTTEQNYTETLQNAISDYYIGALQTAVEVSKEFGKDYWVVPQLHGEYFEKTGKFVKSSGELRLRPPTGNEVKLQCNLAISYGAKGIIPFPLGTDKVIWNGEGIAIFAGLLTDDVNSEGLHFNHWTDYGIFKDSNNSPKKIWVGYKQKWEALSEVMKQYEVLNTTLSSLTWLGAKSWHSNNITSGVWSGFVKEIDVKYFNSSSNSKVSDSQKYVETGHFNQGINDYLYIVNRRTLDSDFRVISVKLYNTTEIKEVFDIYKNKIFYVEPDSKFTESFTPAEGKLYKISTWTVNNLSIANTTGSVQLVWDSIPGSILENYIVERKMNEGVWEIIGVTNIPTFTDVEVRISNLDDFTYKVCAKAKNELPNSLYSNQVTTGGKYIPAKVKMKPNYFSLDQNYPNPFNPITTIKYQLPSNEMVLLKLYDLTGNEISTIVNKFETAGVYEVKLNTSNLSSGTYIYRITAGKYSESRRMLLIK